MIDEVGIWTMFAQLPVRVNLSARFNFSGKSRHHFRRRDIRSTANMEQEIVAAQAAGDPLWEPEWIEGAGETTIRERSATPDDESQITLFCAWFCPFAQRAWIALEEKGIPYKYVEVNTYEVDPKEPGGYTKQPLPLEEKARRYPGFVAASPRGLVPAVTHDLGHVWESIHVVSFIDSVFKGGDALVPREDPLMEAHVRIWADHCTDRMQKTFYTALMEQEVDKQQRTLEAFYKECRMLANAMADPAQGPYFLGATFSLVDVALAPFWQRFVLVGGHYRDLKFPDDDAFARLRVWWEATRARPCVAATIVSDGRLIASYRQYARNTGTSDFAKAMQGSLGKSN